MSNNSVGNGHVSIENLYMALASYISDYEQTLMDDISSITGTGKANTEDSTSTEIDQGQLLSIQARVQTWGTIVSTSTGIVRAIGDGLKSTTQNIR